MSARRKAARSGLSRAPSGRCILCGRPPKAVGVWTPTPEYARRLGGAAGKVTVVPYALCKTHVRPPIPMALIEDKLLVEANDHLRN